ncbi:MAG: hypothetical protein J4478_03845 [Candidatus Diapherotrites archaeon]|uniref:Uncharacterized protein n=1 Tax=Candidatus Iainarchaeum sp. TaxID=3101447 RepID=A0A7J4KUF7_9ARCH|nr:hypothetical protein [Candidatus Diapherotrites archaeon]HIH21678.1 hypothetical protein [Candidatus Diapherotrites archaeon]HIH32890.1 hypothetical protein [Candidatus Diapherotrites archaeon]
MLENKKMLTIAIAVLVAIGLLAVFLNERFEKESNGFENGKEGSVLGERQEYGIPESVFVELPEVPGDFNQVVELYYAGKISADYLSEAYYKQPEFYGNFKKDGLKQWLEPAKDRWAVNGFGITPASQEIKLGEANTAKARVFIYSSFGVRTFQGLRLRAEIPEELKEHLSIEFSEQEFLLEPNFPKFEKEWSQAVDVYFKAKGSIPEGRREIFFSIANPDLEKEKEWGEKYNGFYFNATTFKSGERVFRIILNVEGKV